MLFLSDLFNQDTIQLVNGWMGVGEGYSGTKLFVITYIPILRLTDYILVGVYIVLLKRTYEQFLFSKTTFCFPLHVYFIFCLRTFYLHIGKHKYRLTKTITQTK